MFSCAHVYATHGTFETWVCCDLPMEEATMGFWPASWRTSPVKTCQDTRRSTPQPLLNPLLILAKLLSFPDSPSVEHICLPRKSESSKKQQPKKSLGALRNLEGHQPRHRDIAKHSLEQSSPLAKHVNVKSSHARRQPEATTTNQKPPEATN